MCLILHIIDFLDRSDLEESVRHDIEEPYIHDFTESLKKEHQERMDARESAYQTEKHKIQTSHQQAIAHIEQTHRQECSRIHEAINTIRAERNRLEDTHRSEMHALITTWQERFDKAQRENDADQLHSQQETKRLQEEIQIFHSRISTLS